MPKRLTLENDGILRDRSGQAVARLVSISLELIEPSDDGGQGAGVQSQESLLEVTPQDGGGTKGEGPARSARVDSGDVAAVWECYVATMKPRHKEIGEDERKIITAALKVATVTECCGAIRGCEASDFHMARGQYQGRKTYKTLSHILKGKRPSDRLPNGRTVRETLDFFLDIAAKRGLESQVPSVDPARLRAAKQDVRDALTFPGDVHTVERGQRARQWLEGLGFTVTVEGERVTFAPPGTTT